MLYFKLETLTARVLGPMFRRTGQSLYKQGVAFQAELGHEDRLVPSMRCVPISDAKYPRLLDVRIHAITIFLRLIGLPQMPQLSVMLG